MQHGETGVLGCGRDDQVSDVGAAMLATIREQTLNLDRTIKHPLVDRRSACEKYGAISLIKA